MAWHTEALFALAEEKGWRQRELAKAMGVTEATVSRVRHGRCQPGAAFLVGVERAFPLHDPRKLVWWEEPAPEEVAV
jgi:transcriptional regulator with XRE-family HTH domain